MITLSVSTLRGFHYCIMNKGEMIPTINTINILEKQFYIEYKVKTNSFNEGHCTKRKVCFISSKFCKTDTNLSQNDFQYFLSEFNWTGLTITEASHQLSWGSPGSKLSLWLATIFIRIVIWKCFSNTITVH
jgi:hypothetical protein